MQTMKLIIFILVQTHNTMSNSIKFYANIKSVHSEDSSLGLANSY